MAHPESPATKDERTLRRFARHIKSLDRDNRSFFMEVMSIIERRNTRVTQLKAKIKELEEENKLLKLRNTLWRHKNGSEREEVELESIGTYQRHGSKSFTQHVIFGAGGSGGIGKR